MSNNPNHEKKRQLRKNLLEKRDSMSAEYMGIASRKITDRVLASSEFKDAKDIAMYYSLKSEVSTQKILTHALEHGKNLYLPRVTGSTDMEFCQVLSLSEMVRGTTYSDMVEPRYDSKIAAKIDLMIVPAVAVASEDGHRLGYGRGYYDRYLAHSGVPAELRKPAKHDHTAAGRDAAAAVTTTTIALAFEKQVVKKIPAEKHDVRMDITITEKRKIYNIKKPRAAPGMRRNHT